MQCVHPKRLGNTIDSFGGAMLVPCGRCILCKRSQALDWSIRLKHELGYYGRRSMFLTLTYDEFHLPHRPFSGKLIPTLNIEHMTLFFKRLRKRYSNPDNLTYVERIKYFYCGEYGGETNRPHYHSIIFGLDRNVLKPYIVRYKAGEPVWTSDILNKIWSYGEVTIGTVTQRSIAYVTGYVIDKILDKREHIVKPFRHMSQGIGKAWALNNRNRLLQDMCLHVDGKEVTVPRYYSKLLDLDFEEISVRNLLERELKLKGYKISNDLSERDLLDLIENDAKQREADYRAKRQITSKRK